MNRFATGFLVLAVTNAPLTKRMCSRPQLRRLLPVTIPKPISPLLIFGRDTGDSPWSWHQCSPWTNPAQNPVALLGYRFIHLHCHVASRWFTSSDLVVSICISHVPLSV